jgi:hypothetical protein
VKATPVDAYGRDSTIQHVGLAGHIQNNPGWTSTDALNRKLLVELQYQWSASLAMSADGSFPSRPRQSPLLGQRFEPARALTLVIAYSICRCSAFHPCDGLRFRRDGTGASGCSCWLRSDTYHEEAPTRPF